MYFPVTILYASLLGILLIALSSQVSSKRRRSKVSLGHGGNSQLERTMRAHGNFVEYVPLALVLIMLLETEVTQVWLLHLMGVMLLGGRLLHAYGMFRPDGMIAGRWWGTALTWLMILLTSLLNLWHLV